MASQHRVTQSNVRCLTVASSECKEENKETYRQLNIGQESFRFILYDSASITYFHAHLLQIQQYSVMKLITLNISHCKVKKNFLVRKQIFTIFKSTLIKLLQYRTSCCVTQLIKFIFYRLHNLFQLELYLIVCYATCFSPVNK